MSDIFNKSVQAGRSVRPAHNGRELRRVMTSSFVGSAIEFYDFILYATAATLVFGPVFFSTLDPALAIVASYLTFAAGYAARPLGGIIFGHFGDRVGRKKMLITSMTIMGVVSVLIGLVPPIETWGAIMLLVLRALQGIAIGGEWGGAALMSLEHAGKKNRGFAASFANAGAPFGAFLGTAAMGLFALLPEDQFLAWGWRVPFLISAVLLIFGLYIRLKVSESPLFEQAQAAAMAVKSQKPKVPLFEILRAPKTLIIIGLCGVGGFAIQAMFSTFGVSFAKENGTSPSVALWAFALSQLVATFTIPFFAAISDKIGRKRVMVTGLILMSIFAFPIYGMLAQGSTMLTILAFMIALPLFQSMTFGPMAAFLGESFSTGSRYTGASLGYQISSLLGAGFTPALVASIYGAQGGVVAGSVWYLIGLCVLSALVMLFLAKESSKLDLTIDDAQPRVNA
ncbi:MFS transporter [Glutamicibacter arilaitensis]|uniref:MFS transporter n=1 Tax=Glutamicibacter arilaitensis TaxID=256701 RepID=UPI003850FAEE